MAAVIAESGKTKALTGDGSLPDTNSGYGIIDDFETRLDDITNLIEDGLLPHEMICRILKQLIAMSGYAQIRSLWTSLQPLLHRDYMFTGQRADPNMNFQPISTTLSREKRSYLTKTRNISRFHRAQSAYLTDEEGVYNVNHLPPITGGRAPRMIDRLVTNTEIIDGRRKIVIDRRVTITQNVDGKAERMIGKRPAKVEEKVHFPAIPKNTNFGKTPNKSVRFPNDKITNFRDTKIRKRLKILGDHKNEEIRVKVKKLFIWFEEWTNPERAIFFQQVLPKLEMKQLYFLCTYLSVRQHCDVISKLPTDCSLKILSYLSAEDLARSAAVCRNWHQLCLNGVLWREKCDDLRSQMATPSVTSASIRSWKPYELYRGDQLRQRNWSRAQCTPTYFLGHEAKVLSVTFNKKILVSGSADATVRVWSIRNGTTLQVLTGHNKGVWCVAIFTDALVISGSYDHSVKIWNITSGVCLRTLFGHSGAVWALSCKNNMVATASHDTTIKLWNMSHCKLIHTFLGHSKPVFAVDLARDAAMVFSGSADHSVRIWDAKTKTCLRIIWTANASPVMSVNYADGFLAFSAHKLLFIWDVKEGKYLKNFRGHKCRIEAVRLIVKERNGPKQISLLSAGKDGKLKYWRFGQSKPVNTMVANKDCQINCIAFDKNRLATALYDNSICICDFTKTENIDRHFQL